MLSVAPSRKAHTSSAAPSPTFTLSAALAPGLALVLRQACTGGGGGSGEGMEQAMQRRVAHGGRRQAEGLRCRRRVPASQPASQPARQAAACRRWCQSAASYRQCRTAAAAHCCGAAMRVGTHLRQVQLRRLWRRHKRHRLAGLHLASPERHLAPADCSSQLEPAAGGARGGRERDDGSVAARSHGACGGELASEARATAHALCL